MKMTTWLRARRDRFGGIGPGAGRSASLADFGTIGFGVSVRVPNPLGSAGVVLIVRRLQNRKCRLPTLVPNMAKLTPEWPLPAYRRSGRIQPA
jgi:hypothetical protein